MSGISRLDWGHSYQETQRSTAQMLRDLREQGVVRHVFGDGAAFEVAPCDPSRMSDRVIDTTARLHAERVCNRAINQEIANRRRRGLPLHGMVESL